MSPHTQHPGIAPVTQTWTGIWPQARTGLTSRSLHPSNCSVVLPVTQHAACVAHLQICPGLKRAHVRAVTCHLRLGEFEAAQMCIDTLRALPDGMKEAAASQQERDVLFDAVQQVSEYTPYGLHWSSIGLCAVHLMAVGCCVVTWSAAAGRMWCCCCWWHCAGAFGDLLPWSAACCRCSGRIK